MITAVKPKPRLRAGIRMSLDEFLALGETDERLELIDGALYIMSTPTKDHQFLLARLIVYFELYLDAFTPAPAEVYQDITTIMSPELQRVVEPDLVVILGGRNDIGGLIYVEGVPDIVVEILSSDRSHDLVRKRQIYAEAGVRGSTGFWIRATIRLRCWSCGAAFMRPALRLPPGHADYTAAAWPGRAAGRTFFSTRAGRPAPNSRRGGRTCWRRIAP